MNLDIQSRLALVTGAGRGIGAAIAKELGGEGCVVVVCDKDLEPAQQVAAEIESVGGRAHAVSVDVSDFEATRRCIAEVTGSIGDIDILVNNAGFSLDGPITEMTEEQWDRVVDVCLKGCWAFTREVVPSMIRKKRGRIINIASRAHLGEFNKSNYSAAKAGVIGFTRALSVELGQHDITVNAVAPGLIRTERVLGLRYFDDIDRRAKLSTPIQRPGVPEDIAAAVAFLASERAGFISGETLHVTGGRYSST
ncbi:MULTISPECIES: SDR family NAD(P)-dependent oxidoreductase [unclassified Caballeronia]|uniref:SDR family NAD(P)-dependent oxidoreductase n=1 Tax=unclassified Caballeronia TaxID=2646786 RepID=UPI0028652BD1|nr:MULTISPECIES: SDR family NAD(P)-dependent oxidoreductase [unclassified Caballeronia]MDR5777170.1 SDR family NAD(P)-dependent oxidoreductase [Caballeronia sp. LZ002]MDR5852605.1 SDR family NAD(P)-dependent oxidoreductase [Caballeronia sp. LZ003]